MVETMQTDFEEGVCKPLPEGKSYHVFISYRDIDENREWVRQFISKLTYSYNIICCDHVRDFQPGRKIVDNIKNAISSSVKTLIILTKGYTESFWCEYEIEYALLMNMDMKERLLIPVLKEDCDIPDYLKPFTYIDARGNMDSWLPQLVSVIESEARNTHKHKERQLKCVPFSFVNCILWSCYTISSPFHIITQNENKIDRSSGNQYKIHHGTSLLRGNQRIVNMSLSPCLRIDFLHNSSRFLKK
ncbi:unnamed protein product [Mytilus coruscus]|uniref:TIR domain-containing protein n=1 Tax=Mytilus coruscus TaxID=42192 RepID=A0A6J8CBZ7_MYTCO|nr:unnamed protein product [Mytilus coruscus]